MESGFYVLKFYKRVDIKESKHHTYRWNLRKTEIENLYEEINDETKFKY